MVSSVSGSLQAHAKSKKRPQEKRQETSQKVLRSFPAWTNRLRNGAEIRLPNLFNRRGAESRRVYAELLAAVSALPLRSLRLCGEMEVSIALPSLLSWPAEKEPTQQQQFVEVTAAHLRQLFLAYAQPSRRGRQRQWRLIDLWLRRSQQRAQVFGLIHARAHLRRRRRTEPAQDRGRD